jgi:hypothetical protein
MTADGKVIPCRIVKFAKGSTRINKAHDKFYVTESNRTRIPNNDEVIPTGTKSRPKRIIPVHQFDIRTAYLNAPLQHDVYMKIPTDIPDESLRGTTVKLKRALYGLKQAGFEWFSHLRETLLRLGWTSDDLFPCRYKTTRESEDYFIHSNIQRITLNAFRINTVGIVKSYCE